MKKRSGLEAVIYYFSAPDLILCLLSKEYNIYQGDSYMMFKSKLIPLIASLIITGSSFAAKVGDDAIICPSVESIKSLGVSMPEVVGFNSYIVYNMSNYDTDNVWAFVIGLIPAESDDDAVNQANDALTTLSGNPEPIDYSGHIMCDYNIGSGLMAIASIVDGNIPVPNNLRSLLRPH